MSDIQAPLPGYTPPAQSTASVKAHIYSAWPDGFLAGHMDKPLGTSARSPMPHLVHLSGDQQRRERSLPANTPVDIASSVSQNTYNQGNLSATNSEEVYRSAPRASRAC